MDLELSGKRALITGGSRGIGLAIARVLAEEGADIVIASRGAEALQAAAASIVTRPGRQVVPITVDTADDASVQALVASTVASLGGIDILVNSAANTGVDSGASRGQWPKLADTTDQAFWEDVNVKVVGYLRTARAVAPIMLDRGWGRIINISGLGARKTNSIVRSIRNVSVAALTKNLADELGPGGINVTVVHPGSTRTERIGESLRAEAERSGQSLEAVERKSAGNAIDKLVDAEEVAWVVAFLASPKSISISGDAIAVGGGTLGSIYY